MNNHYSSHKKNRHLISEIRWRPDHQETFIRPFGHMNPFAISVREIRTAGFFQPAYFSYYGKRQKSSFLGLLLAYLHYCNILEFQTS